MNKAKENLKKGMAEERWYKSKEHFRTEKSFEEHEKDLKEMKDYKKRNKPKINMFDGDFGFNFKPPKKMFRL